MVVTVEGKVPMIENTASLRRGLRPGVKKRGGAHRPPIENTASLRRGLRHPHRDGGSDDVLVSSKTPPRSEED